MRRRRKKKVEVLLATVVIRAEHCSNLSAAEWQRQPSSFRTATCAAGKRFPVCPPVSLWVSQSGVSTAVRGLRGWRRWLMIPASPQDVAFAKAALGSGRLQTRPYQLTTPAGPLRSLNRHWCSDTLIISAFIATPSSNQCSFISFCFFSFSTVTGLQCLWTPHWREMIRFTFCFIFLDDDSCEAALLQSGMKNKHFYY